MIYAQELAAASEILTAFNMTCFILLFAQMQSGKTNTFKLVACEMLRTKKVKNVIIFSGNREIQLTAQLCDHSEFIESYISYLQTTHGMGDEAVWIARGIVSKLVILGGQDLISFKLLPGETLYIWEESHFGQSEKQHVDKFLIHHKLNANGEASQGNFILSVSATPFSEMADLCRLNQPKQCVRLIPSDDYLSVQKLKETERIVSIIDAEKSLYEILPKFKKNGYGLIRASTKQQKMLTRIATSLGWECIRFDQETTSIKIPTSTGPITIRFDKDEKDINTILNILPSKKTIIFIKGMCRMGKRIKKHNILFGMETSNANTDTLLQGLLGRWCGYTDHLFEAPMYLFNLNISELDRYIELVKGNIKSIPLRASNIERCRETTRYSIIPCRIVDDKDGDYEIADTILQSLENGTFENPNDARDEVNIRTIIKTICEARQIASKHRTPEQKQLAESFKYHVRWNETGKKSEERKQQFNKTFASITEAFELKQARNFGTSYGSISSNKDVLIVWKPKGSRVIYLYTFIKRDYVEKVVPTTTGLEVFCRPYHK